MDLQAKKLNDLVDYKNGLWTGKKAPFQKAKVVRATEFNEDGSYNLSTAKELDVEVKQIQERIIKPGQILLERSGGGENKPVGRVILFKDDVNNSIYSFSNFTTLLKPNETLAYPQYLFYYLHFFYTSGKTNDYQKAVIGIRNLEFKRYLELDIPVPYKNNQPDLVEQERIAKKINKLFIEIDKAIEQIKTALANSNNLLKSELKNIFEKEGTHNWKVAKLKEVCEFFNGKAHEKDIAKDGKYIVVNSKFISLNGSKIKRSNKAYYPLKKNDLVMVMSDVPNGKALAKCFVVNKNNVYTLNQRICALRSEKFETRFLYYQLNRNKFYLSFDNGQKQTNLRKDDILECPLFVPEISEQKKIAERLDKIKEQSEELTQKYKEQLNNFNKLKQSILNQAFQGKL